jgi:uncharacterized protein (DUF2235 family)
LRVLRRCTDQRHLHFFQFRHQEQRVLVTDGAAFRFKLKHHLVGSHDARQIVGAHDDILRAVEAALHCARASAGRVFLDHVRRHVLIAVRQCFFRKTLRREECVERRSFLAQVRKRLGERCTLHAQTHGPFGGVGRHRLLSQTFDRNRLAPRADLFRVNSENERRERHSKGKQHAQNHHCFRIVQGH